MYPILDLENHEQFALDEVAIEPGRGVVEVERKSVVFVDDFLPFIL